MWSILFDDSFNRVVNLWLFLDVQNYAEEMLRIREAQLAELNAQRQRLIENLDYLQMERKKDQTQLESVIVELQTQM
jgi:hypothetical protein